MALILVCELSVDWIKHAFVIKFNHISPKVYAAFVHLLCCDAAGAAPPRPQRSGAGGASRVPAPPRSDAADQTTRAAARMGFQPLPLLCLVIRVVGHDVAPRLYLGHPSGMLLCVLIWLVLCFLKVIPDPT